MFLNDTIKNSLNAHSVIGLTVGALIYIICLTGTLVVLEREIERWQQPAIPEFNDMSASAIANSANIFLNEANSSPESLYVVLPTEDLPRAHVSDVETEWYVDQQGARLDEPEEGFLHLLVEMHVHLHLGETIGIIVVSCFGAMLLGLIISGVIAHPKIFKEAFRLKLGGQKRLEQVDIHNRLSVWGLPFHLMMGITGAYFGLVGIMGMLAATFYFDGDQDQLIEAVYGKEPVVVTEPTHQITAESIEKSLTYLKTLGEQEGQPEVSPIYFVFHKIGTDSYFFEIAATHADRLIYSEMYRFHSNGDYMNYQQLSDGPAGRQIAYSVYRLHFGQFDNNLIKIAYIILGLALTIVSVTGINIWLAKSNQSQRVKSIWNGFIWGTPIALTVTALLSILFSITALTDFFLGLCISIVIAAFINHELKSKQVLKWILLVLIAALIVSHYMLYPSYAFTGGSLWVNCFLIVVAVYLAIPSKTHVPQKNKSSQRTGQPLNTPTN